MRSCVYWVAVVVSLWGFVPGDCAAAESDPVVQVSAVISPRAVRPGADFDVIVTIDIAEGWHINANRPMSETSALGASETLTRPGTDFQIPTELSFPGAPPFVAFSDFKYPPAISKPVSFSEIPLDLYEGRILITAPLHLMDNAPPGTYALHARLRYQACDDEKCLPPATLPMDVSLVIEPGVAAGSRDKFVGFSEAGKSGIIESVFREKGFVLSLVAIFWAGVLLNLTPCVYPMIPITVAYFGGRAAPGGTGSPVAGALAYFLGIVVTYSVLGTAAGLSGGLFGAVLQYPAVLIGLAVLMIYFSAGMFGWAPFGLPQSWADRAGAGRVSASGAPSAGVSGAGKVPLGPFGMGVTMGVVAAPCIGPFVAGLLAYVGSTKSAFAGFSLFAVMSCGLGLPYLLLGLFSSRIRHLPKLGEWMNAVKWMFGFVLLGMAVYFISPLTSDAVEAGLYAAVLCASAVTALVISAGKSRFTVVASLALAAGLFGAAYRIAQPADVPADDGFWLPYDAESFNMAVSSGSPVILDFFAEWCAPCKKLDRITFSDPRVRSALEKAVRLKVDLTLYETPESTELREKFAVSGVPTTIYLDSSGRERFRYEGFFPPEEILRELSKIES